MFIGKVEPAFCFDGVSFYIRIQVECTFADGLEISRTYPNSKLDLVVFEEVGRQQALKNDVSGRFHHFWLHHHYILWECRGPV